MSILRDEQVVCACGTPVRMTVADSINATRLPHWKQALLDRTLHVFRCDACQRLLVVEKDVMYIDFDRRQFFCMYPRTERANEAALSAQVKRAYQLWLNDNAPPFLAEAGKDFLVRVCFGYEELREKVVIDDAGLSDLVVEALKLDILTAEPWFEQAGVVTLRLDAVAEDGALRLVPEFLEPPPAGEPKVVTASRELYNAVDDRFDDILGHHPGLAAGAHVSLLRLIAWPQVTAQP